MATHSQPDLAEVPKVPDLYERNPERVRFHFLLGERFLQDQTPSKALQEFHQALRYDPHEPYLHLKIAQVLLALGNIEGSLAFARSSVELDPEDADSQMLLGKLHMITDMFPEARTNFEAVIRLEPLNEEAYLSLAAIETEEKNYAKAIAIIERFIAANEDRKEIGFFFLGRVHAGQGEERRAIASYLQSLDANARFLPAAKSLAFSYQQIGDRPRAIEFLKYCLTLDPTDTTLRERLAALYLEGEDLESALVQYQMLSELDPENANARLRAALILFRMKKFEHARNLMTEILQENPESDRVQFYLAAILVELKEYPSAIEELGKIGTDSDHYAEARVQLASIQFLKLRKPDAAVSSLEKAILDRPREIAFYSLLASILEREKKYEKAIEVIERGLALFPDHEDLLYSLGSIYEKQDKVELAVESMKRILERSPNHVNALNFIGYTYVERNTHMDEAEKYLKRALTIAPENGYVVDSWGWLQYRKGRYSEAVQTLERAVKLEPNVAVIRRHLGEAYEGLKNSKKALENYRRALTLNESDDLIDEEVEDQLIRRIRRIEGIN